MRSAMKQELILLQLELSLKVMITAFPSLPLPPPPLPPPPPPNSSLRRKRFLLQSIKLGRPVMAYIWTKKDQRAITHYHTMPHFDALKIYSYGKHCEKRRNCLLQAISPFSQCFYSTLYGTCFSFYCKCTLKCRLQFVTI